MAFQTLRGRRRSGLHWLRTVLQTVLQTAPRTVLRVGLLAWPLALPLAVQAQTLTLGTKLELNTLDPHFFASFPTGSSHENLYERLTRLDENGAVQPQLASSWRSIDADTWEFKLRANVRFHDGTPFTAEDVAFTISRVPNVPNSPNSFAQFTRNIERVEILVPTASRNPSPATGSCSRSTRPIGVSVRRSKP